MISRQRNKDITNIKKDLRPSKSGFHISLHGWQRVKELLLDTKTVVEEVRCDCKEGSLCQECNTYEAEILGEEVGASA